MALAVLLRLQRSNPGGSESGCLPASRKGGALLERLQFQRDSGQDLVEYALAFMAFMTMILLIIEFGVVIWSYDTIANAAREGARYGIIHPDDTAGIEDVARQRALALNQGRLEVVPTRIDEEDNPTIEVVVTYVVQPFTPFLRAIQLETAATMRLEQRGHEEE
jgi:hypothetical protein